MKDSLALPGTEAPREGWLDQLARRTVQASLERLRHGRVTLIEAGARYDYGRVADGGNPASARETIVQVHVHSPEAYRRVAFGGSVGAGRAYMDGLWSTDDLPSLVRIFAINEAAHFGLESGWARLAGWVNRLRHRFRGNSKRGSRRNIAAHYDLGNDFYRLFLDETMAYSCAVFERPDASLREASEAKFRRIGQKLQLGAGDHLLEIGTGWGGFAVFAAREYGCQVTTTTISDEQYRFARSRVAELGLSDRVEILLQDYRDLVGRYDKLVSIEMIEAVGDDHLDTFFAQCDRLLKDEGLMALQSITIADQAFDRHRLEADFIKRYIFPGSCIPSVTALLQSATRTSSLRLQGLDDITEHYVTTLQRWRSALAQSIDRVRAQGYSESFIRMWEFYLSYCEGGFAERYLGNVQMLLAKPAWRWG